ncbi:CHAT domain-containing protein [Aetokthonos hydrillicola Thurmond2011]|jgi:CHAT domain-containing protein|uniref:CHAT domain-containing protein n=1 Tax=Aetokthonos hydrillicola Thurmond2011 TaxID=2712845 RepID=A0AAP5IEQ7_9CYAN|nr:CHAT domain-containing protein [Aetokthonos hydrillicola]MBO3457218.1 CHAT domain-containing protein [Aetokthonos hydrillicola CCALA 1050]MBW4587568.1 CHAT domain-containing protein [Aetokthonos hydrillicola CCALA 1050]MDR9900166.1 CHAT domain-containing protein [Aetokthonos hydrillicola Thurmond2011]
MYKNKYTLNFTKYGIYFGGIAFFLAINFVKADAYTIWQLQPSSKLNLVSDSQLNQNFITNFSDPKSQLNQGRNLFEAGSFAESVKFWEAASVTFEKQGDTINEALSFSYLSLAYQKLGDWQKAEITIGKSLDILKHIKNQKQGNSTILAVALNALGNLKLSTGKAEAALKAWQDAESAYAIAGDEVGKVGSQINQAQAMRALGLYLRAQKLLLNVHQKLQNQPDSIIKAKALQSLGIAFQLVEDVQLSVEILQQSLKISKGLNSATDINNILFNLGNTARDLQKTEVALGYYQQVVAQSDNSQLRVEALLNQFSLYLETGQVKLTQALSLEIKSQLEKLPPSRISLYATINFARNLSQLSKLDRNDSVSYRESAQILARAVQRAKMLGDLRAQAYALNELGKLYFDKQQLADALKLSQQALQITQEINATDISYQAAWQVGRILKKQGDIQGAIAAYDSSVKTLKSLRGDLVAINRDVQFSFQESVEPIYRELVDLLLQSPQPSQQNLKLARDTIEGLQLAELDNFFREACLNAKPEQIDQIDKQAAVIYPIILGDRLEVILSIPGKPLSSYKTNLADKEIEKTIKQMRQSLNPIFSNEERLYISQKLYEWLIRPAESQLNNSGVKTLAFVLDGSLRNIPMAALYDGKQYLLEKYSLALSPGMQLMPARSLKRENLRLMTAGLSESRQGFKALPAVKSEVTEISSEVNSKLLLNEKFTDTNLQQAIESTPFSVLHLATHGQFSSKSDDTFILSWNDKINVKKLSEFLQTRNESQSTTVELMVLSACQTAKGDNRAILGLAGVAVRSGARSTLATLWAVKDESTAKFMVEFYKNLRQPGISKAEALRQTQISFLQNADFSHPFYWSTFVLVGNWL